MTKRPRLNLKLETKYVLFLVLVFSVLLALFLVSSKFVLQILEDNIYMLNAEILETAANVLDSHIENIELYGDSFLTNNVYQEALYVIASTDDKVEASKAQREVSQQLSFRIGENPYISGVCFTFPEGGPLYSGDGYVSDMTFRKMAEENALEAAGRPVWITDSEGSLYYVRDLRRVKYLQLDHLAYLYLKIDFERMVEDLNKDFLIAVYDSNTELFSNFALSESDRTELFPKLREKTYTTARLNKKNYLVSRISLNGGAWHCLSFFDTTSINKTISKSFLTASIGTALILFLTLLLIRSAVKWMLRHVHVLEDKMDAFSSGKLDLSQFQDYEDMDDEIGKLHRDFDKMVKRFEELIEDNYVNKLIVKDSQLQLMSQQVNPYFLSNVLDSIYWSAQCHGDEDIAEMTYSLACLLRLTSSEPSITVSIADEMEYLEHYLTIQRTRFPERIKLEKDIDESLLGTKVPRLSLQPLVENALTHSMRKYDRPCLITLRLYKEGDKVFLSVRNTGSVFPEWETNGKNTIKSIRERLALIYGEEAELNTFSEDDSAIAIISVPFEGDIHVQSIDSP